MAAAAVLSLRGSVRVEIGGDGVSTVDVNGFKAGLVVGTTSGRVSAVDCDSLTVVHTLTRHSACVTDLQCNLIDTHLLATSSRDGTIAVHDIRSSALPVARFRQCLESEDVNCLSVAMSGPLIACGINNAVRLFDLRTATATLEPYKRCLLAEFSQSHTDVVNCVRFHPCNPALVFSSADDDLIALHDVRHLSGDGSFSTPPARAASSNSMVEYATKKEGEESDGSDGSPAEDAAFVGALSNESPARILHFFSDSRLATASTVESFRLWEVQCCDDGFETAAPLGPASNAIRCYEPFADTVEKLPAGVIVGFTKIRGRELVIGASNSTQTMAIWKLEVDGSLEPLTTFSSAGGHTGVVRCCTAFDEQQVIVTAGEEGLVSLWA